MPDDIVTFGGPERRPGREADESVESLFHAHYPRIVYTAFSLVGDWDLAEQLAQEAYLRLWRHWRSISDPGAPPLYLQRTVVNLSRGTIRRKVIERRTLRARSMERAGTPEPDPAAVIELRRAIAGLPMRKRECVVLRHLLGLSEALGHAGTSPVTSERPIDIARAWHDFQLLRSRRSRNRRRGLTATAVLAAVGIAVTFPVLAAIGSSASGPERPATRTTSASPGASPRSYSGTVVARIPLSHVGMVVQDGARAWATRSLSQTPSGRFNTQLVSIDLRTNKVALRMNLIGTAQSTVAAGGGRVWLTTSRGQAQGQIDRIDPATGRVIATMHLPSGRCYYAAYSSGSLWATCADGPAHTEFFRIDPASGQVVNRAGPVRGQIRSITVGRDAVWYTNAGSGITGMLGIGGQERLVTVHDRTNTVSFSYTDSLVSGQGYVWALSTDESVAKIDPATGRVVRIYTYRSYDPGYGGGLDFLAVGHSSLWFLADGYPLSGVLRVNIATGKPVGQAGRIARGSCSQPCWQIYSTPSAIWVPTHDRLIRIDPARPSD